MEKPKILSCLRTIRFQDCDPFNHLNNGRYLDYFMNAREDHLIENYGIDIYKIARETGLSWVVSLSQMAYIKPVFLMEEVNIESQLIAFSDKDLLVEMRMFDAAGSILKSVLWCRFVHFNISTARSELHNSDWMDFFESVHLPVDEDNFEQRCGVLLSQKSKGR